VQQQLVGPCVSVAVPSLSARLSLESSRWQQLLLLVVPYLLLVCHQHAKPSDGVAMCVTPHCRVSASALAFCLVLCIPYQVPLPLCIAECCIWQAGMHVYGPHPAVCATLHLQHLLGALLMLLLCCRWRCKQQRRGSWRSHCQHRDVSSKRTASLMAGPALPCGGCSWSALEPVAKEESSHSTPGVARHRTPGSGSPVCVSLHGFGTSNHIATNQGGQGTQALCCCC